MITYIKYFHREPYKIPNSCSEKFQKNLEERKEKKNTDKNSFDSNNVFGYIDPHSEKMQAPTSTGAIQVTIFSMMMKNANAYTHLMK